MDGTALWRRITNSVLSNSLRDFSLNSSSISPGPPPNSLLNPVLDRTKLLARVCSIFPPGFELSQGSDCNEPPYSYSPRHFYNTLADKHNGNQHVASTVVASAWYCKQKEGAEHEFVVLWVGDLMIPGLQNCVALDRNRVTPPPRKGHSSSSDICSNSPATDKFRVSYDGDLVRLLDECQLTNYLKLEEINFLPIESPRLLRLAKLVAHLSSKYPIYTPLGKNCYWFTGLIWECMRKMCPRATHLNYLPKKRGKFFIRIGAPSKDQVREELRDFQQSIETSNSEPAQDSQNLSSDVGENIAQPPPDFTSNSIANPTRELSFDPPPHPSHGASSLGERLHVIFPPGLDGNSQGIKQPYAFTPRFLYNMLAGRHAEQTVVASAWYGKQTKSAMHEFIVIQVEDLAIPGLKNYIAIDRNQGAPTATIVSSTSSAANAFDAFRVSYDGDLNQFLRVCQLAPYMKLEQILFQRNDPLPLFKLASLALCISDQYTRYNPMDTNCYWFAGLIWECMLRLCPTASHELVISSKRGKFGFVRSIPNPIQVRRVLREVQIEPPDSENSQGHNDSTSEPNEDVAMTELQVEELVTGDTP